MLRDKIDLLERNDTGQPLEIVRAVHRKEISAVHDYTLLHCNHYMHSINTLYCIVYVTYAN